MVAAGMAGITGGVRLKEEALPKAILKRMFTSGANVRCDSLEVFCRLYKKGLNRPIGLVPAIKSV